VKPVQPLNTLYSKVVTLEGIVIEVNNVQLAKVSCCSVDIPEPKFTLVKPIHPAKAWSPIDVTEFGIVMVINAVHLSNA
jgi:hypothetical protein